MDTMQVQPEIIEGFRYKDHSIKLFIYDPSAEGKEYTVTGHIVKEFSHDVEVFYTNKLEPTTFSGSVSRGFEAQQTSSKAAAVEAGIKAGKRMIDREFE